MIKELQEIEPHKYFTAVLVFIGVLSPGLLIIWLFQPDLFKDLDTFKLTLFALSVSAPIYVTNIFLMVFVTSLFDNDSYLEGTDLTIAGFLSSFATYPPIAACYFGSLNFSHLCIMIAVMEVVCLIAVYRGIRSEHKNKSA